MSLWVLRGSGYYRPRPIASRDRHDGIAAKQLPDQGAAPIRFPKIADEAKKRQDLTRRRVSPIIMVASDGGMVAVNGADWRSGPNGRPLDPFRAREEVNVCPELLRETQSTSSSYLVSACVTTAYEKGPVRAGRHRLRSRQTQSMAGERDPGRQEVPVSPAEVGRGVDSFLAKRRNKMTSILKIVGVVMVVGVLCVGVVALATDFT